MLDWADNTEPNLAGYDVYRASFGGTYTKLNTGGLLTSSTFNDTTVGPNTNAYYSVTAIANAAGGGGSSASNNNSAYRPPAYTIPAIALTENQTEVYYAMPAAPGYPDVITTGYGVTHITPDLTTDIRGEINVTRGEINVTRTVT